MIPSYRGPLKAVILDWAGTTVDFGCLAPVVVLQEVFGSSRVEITIEEARRNMGLLKRDHIRSILSQSRVSEAWSMRYGKLPSEDDVATLFEQFVPLQIESIVKFSDVIAGVPEAVAAMRQRGLRIGSTTGYTRPMLDAIFAKSEDQGYRPDVSVTPDEAGAGRPLPWMCWLNLIRLGVFPAAACVKIGDTPSDMEEGLNAGMWTIAVLDSGNEIGLSSERWNELDACKREQLRVAARDRLLQAGAQFIVNTLSDVHGVLDQIEMDLSGLDPSASHSKQKIRGFADANPKRPAQTGGE